MAVPMDTEAFDFELDPERVAQYPAERREAARLMVLHRATGRWEHRGISDLPGLLRAGDLLVVNNTRVIPARVTGRREDTGGRVELLLLEEHPENEWDVLLRAGRRPPPGARLRLGSGKTAVEVLSLGERGRARVRLDCPGPALEWLEAEGATPLPPYIRRTPRDPAVESADRDRYQTVFATRPGSVAAPTAGLHFSPRLLKRLEEAGIGRAEITLHVGIGTFRPVYARRIEAHHMDEERYEVPHQAAERIQAARRRGGRIVAVGSTTVRTLETLAAEDGALRAGSGRTSLFIHPPYRFRAIDGMLTNFHLPRSTLLMMVCALAGRERVLAAYREAARRRYRFFSYGDAMLII